MRLYQALPILGLSLVLAACASSETPAKKGRITMQQAVHTAEASAPGSQVQETHLENEEGRAVYQVELMFTPDYTRTVSVDAHSGRVVKTEVRTPNGVTRVWLQPTRE